VVLDSTSIVKGILSGNKGPDPRKPDNRVLPNYGITASLDSDVLEIKLVFKSGSAYCCDEFDCHLSLFEGERWNKLRDAFNEKGIALQPRLKLKVVCAIEEGAMFYDLSKPKPVGVCEYAFEPAEADGYEYEILEGKCV